MRRLALVTLLALGCSGSPSTPGKPAPKVGDRVISQGLTDLWHTADAKRKAEKLRKAGDTSSPEYKDLDKSRFELLSPGSLIEVLEIGEDYVAINAIRDRSGTPINLHGYIDRWW